MNRLHRPTLLRTILTIQVWLLTVGSVALLSCPAKADTIVIDEPVEDTIGMLTDREKGELEEQLRALRDDTSVQMAILLVGSTGSVPIEDFSLEQAEKWGGGDAGVDQGVLLVVALYDRQSRLEVGYGLEDSLTDAVAQRSLDNVIPLMRDKQYAEAFASIVSDVAIVARGADLPDHLQKPFADPRRKHIPAFFIVFALGLLLGGLFRQFSSYIAGLVEEKTTRRVGYVLVWVVGATIVGAFVPAPFVLSFIVTFLLGTLLGALLRHSFSVHAGSTVLEILILASSLCMVWFFYKNAAGWRPPWNAADIYVSLIFIVVFAFAAFAASMALAIVLMIVSLPLAWIEHLIRGVKTSETWIFQGSLALLTTAFGLGSRGGGSSSYSRSGYSSSSSSSRSSSSSSSSSFSSSSSSWSGGGGSFGGGGASSSW